VGGTDFTIIHVNLRIKKRVSENEKNRP
jgi:hypothetical protein